MQLPTSFNLGTRRYTVAPSNPTSGPYGRFFRYAAHMTVAVTYKQKPRTTKAIAETFWHEVTHAILSDMHHPLWNDEQFVTAFSKRLTQVIYSARFK